jgi:hypothetical protein
MATLNTYLGFGLGPSGGRGAPLGLGVRDILFTTWFPGWCWPSGWYSYWPIRFLAHHLPVPGFGGGFGSFGGLG